MSKPAPFIVLLIAYERGTLSLDVFRARISELGEVSTAQVSRWIAEIKAEVAAGTVSERVGRSVLDMLTFANSATRVDDAVLATQAHTLRIQPAMLVREPEAPVASAAADRTQVITERLVKSLDQVEVTRQGPLQPGDVVKNRFVLERLIGKGGMGLVFSAIDRRKQEAQDPNPRVAFKVLNADFERHPQSWIALQREARKAQTLAHPNVVTVFDFDRDGDTVYYTEAYATDEMVIGAAPHPTDDMFALGIIGYELITGFHPYERRSAREARELGIKPPPLKGLKLREARALERCLSFDRKQRPVVEAANAARR